MISKRIHITIGMRQGCPLSPLLFYTFDETLGTKMISRSSITDNNDNVAIKKQIHHLPLLPNSTTLNMFLKAQPFVTMWFNLRKRMALNTTPSAQVYTDGMISKRFHITLGTRQECPFSPLLFSLLIKPLARKLYLGVQSKAKYRTYKNNLKMYWVKTKLI